MGQINLKEFFIMYVATRRVFRHDFQYVTKKEAAPFKEKIRELLCLVQDEVRKYFTFSFEAVGSSSRNMITCDRKDNIGFDFDFNIEPNDPENKYDAYKMRNIIYEAIRKHSGQFGYTRIEDSTSVITIKAVDHRHKKIKYSCDFAIVYNYKKNGKKIQQYIRYNKERNTFYWENRGKGFYIERKINWLKKNRRWTELREYYLLKKNKNCDPNKHSRSILAESVNEMYERYHG